MNAVIAYLRKDPDSDDGIEFPDVPGCVPARHVEAAEEKLAG